MSDIPHSGEQGPPPADTPAPSDPVDFSPPPVDVSWERVVVADWKAAYAPESDRAHAQPGGESYGLYELLSQSTDTAPAFIQEAAYRARQDADLQVQRRQSAYLSARLEANPTLRSEMATRILDTRQFPLDNAASTAQLPRLYILGNDQLYNVRGGAEIIFDDRRLPLFLFNALLWTYKQEVSVQEMADQAGKPFGTTLAALQKLSGAMRSAKKYSAIRFTPNETRCQISSSLVIADVRTPGMLALAPRDE